MDMLANASTAVSLRSYVSGKIGGALVEKRGNIIDFVDSLEYSLVTGVCFEQEVDPFRVRDLGWKEVVDKCQFLLAS